LTPDKDPVALRFGLTKQRLLEVVVAVLAAQPIAASRLTRVMLEIDLSGGGEAEVPVEGG
jgi:hypothetical protein